MHFTSSSALVLVVVALNLGSSIAVPATGTGGAGSKGTPGDKEVSPATTSPSAGTCTLHEACTKLEADLTKSPPKQHSDLSKNYCKKRKEEDAKKSTGTTGKSKSTTGATGATGTTSTKERRVDDPPSTGGCDLYKACKEAMEGGGAGHSQHTKTYCEAKLKKSKKGQAGSTGTPGGKSTGGTTGSTPVKQRRMKYDDLDLD